jgi:hypothetical protein
MGLAFNTRSLSHDIRREFARVERFRHLGEPFATGFAGILTFQAMLDGLEKEGDEAALAEALTIRNRCTVPDSLPAFSQFLSEVHNQGATSAKELLAIARRIWASQTAGA